MKYVVKTYPRAFKLMLCSLVAAALGIATPFLSGTTATSIAVAQQQSNPQTEITQPIGGTLQKGTPEYDTVLPAGKEIKDYGGWTRVSPPNRDPVFAYVDKIGAVPINVSQQPLPKELSEQPETQVEQLARGYAANRRLSAGNAIVFVGTSAKGPQSLIVVKGKLLILIKASAAIPDAEWQKYIQSLS